MRSPSKLYSFRKYRNWEEKDVANELALTIQDYQALENGEVRTDINTAQKLSDLYLVPIEYFLSDESIIINYNSGSGSHSNSGYIHTYNNNCEMVKLLFDKLEEQNKLIVILQKEISRVNNRTT